MKITTRHDATTPSEVPDCWSARIIGRDGQEIEIVEQMGGGFAITAQPGIASALDIRPVASNRIIVGVRRG